MAIGVCSCYNSYFNHLMPSNQGGWSLLLRCWRPPGRFVFGRTQGQGTCLAGSCVCKSHLLQMQGGVPHMLLLVPCAARVSLSSRQAVFGTELPCS
jgi:hypothetical protein